MDNDIFMGYTVEELEEALAHYGVLGMRWGVRKGRGTPRAQSTDAQSARNLRKKSASELSNQEIEAYLKRARLEKQFSEATATRSQKAKKWLATQLSKSVKQAAERGSKVVVKQVIEPELAKKIAEAQARQAARKAAGG